MHALAVDVLLVHGHSAPGNHVESPRQRRALVFAERRALTQFQQFPADAVAEPFQLEFRRREDVNVHVVDVSFVPFVCVSIDVPGQVVFEVLVQPSRHAPVAVVECVERAVLEPELLRQLVPAEALLQREGNAKTTRRSRAAAGASRVARRSAVLAGM